MVRGGWLKSHMPSSARLPAGKPTARATSHKWLLIERFT
jgi:hypothetical protein